MAALGAQQRYTLCVRTGARRGHAAAQGTPHSSNCQRRSDRSSPQDKARRPSGEKATHSTRQQRQNSAQQRYVLALQALATVRKMLKPMPSVFDLGLHPVAETVGVPHRRGNLTSTAQARASVRNGPGSLVK
jgi:hypothetical protein